MISSEETILPYSRGQLDIVRDCADLKGRFRPTVIYDSVLFNHGDPDEMSVEEIEANTYRVAGACLQASHIGIEIACARNPEILRRDFKLINDALHAGRPMPETVYHTWGAYAIYGIARGLKEAGRTDIPEFFPVDKWDDPAFGIRLLIKENLINDAGDGFIAEQVDSMRQREATVIRQLYAKGIEVDDGTERHIAYIQGSQHGHTHDAMEALEARATRTYVDSPESSLFWTTVSQMRTCGSDDADPVHVRALEHAVRLYDFLCAISSDLLRMITGEQPELDVFANLGKACVEGYHHTLSPDVQHIFTQLDHAFQAGDRTYMMLLLADTFAASVVDMKRNSTD